MSIDTKIPHKIVNQVQPHVQRTACGQVGPHQRDKAGSAVKTSNTSHRYKAPESSSPHRQRQSGGLRGRGRRAGEGLFGGDRIPTGRGRSASHGWWDGRTAT